MEYSDAAVVKRVLGGEVEAFGILVERYFDHYVRFAAHLVGNREDAEEVVQDTFVRAYRALGRYEERERFGAWLLRTQPDPTLPVLLLMVALAGSFLVSYAHARAQGIGLAADVGLAPRTERLVLVIVGVALAGLGWTAGLIGALAIIAALTIVTVVQRIRHVWNLTQASTPESKEN